ncbi:MAG: hypothetical protein P4M14_01475 [Gammaproteobacteria bacterium]|nr:hypothetical protein [Gammaproteobacteria bacterium]
MMILQSLTGLILLLAFFTFMGLGVTNAKFVRNNLALLPLFGFSACIGLSYVISANFRITGYNAFSISIFLLLGSYLIRVRRFSGVLNAIRENGELKLFLAVTAIPIITLLLPAIMDGFQYFYGYVNYDFYFNSQDSVFLQTHNVTEFNKNNVNIVPIAWSADFSGRIGEAMIGAFFPKWLHMDTLRFNSLLLNTIVVLFALSMSAFCKNFFNFNKKTTLFAVFCAVMSGSYAQAYAYYVLGQISVLPVFVVYCIFLKKFIDGVSDKTTAKNITHLAIILALLLNVLFIMYAIMSFFALVISGICYLACLGNPFKKGQCAPWLKLLGLTILTFCLVRLFVLPETLDIVQSWIKLSHRVATVKADTFVVFSDYLTSDFLSLLLGIVNYPSPRSLLGLLTPYGFIRSGVILGAGIISMLITLLVLKSYLTNNENSKAARAIVTSLFGILLTLSIYFFINFTGYGIYKLQTWFMPILVTLYVYYISKVSNTVPHVLLKIGCLAFLFFTIATGVIYLEDFYAPAKDQHFINVHGVTGNKDFQDVVAHIQKANLSPISLYLNNGMEVAWFANLLRTTKMDAVTHNTQPLIEKDFHDGICQSHHTPNWPLSGAIIVTNSHSAFSDIVEPPRGGKALYQNESFEVYDPNQIETLIYFGEGSYPAEHFPNTDHSFPEVFRWIEQGSAIYIYSNQDKSASLTVELTPGYVDNHQKPRIIVIKTDSGTYQYTLPGRTTLTLPNQKIHKGLNCFTIESPDKVTHAPTYGALLRPLVSMDPRLDNFAISYVGIK